MVGLWVVAVGLGGEGGGGLGAGGRGVGAVGDGVLWEMLWEMLLEMLREMGAVRDGRVVEITVGLCARGWRM